MAKALISPLRGSSWSANYRQLPPEQTANAAACLRDAWKDETLPARQRDLVDLQLQAYKAGAPDANFDALVDLLRSLGKQVDAARLLEIGCSSGYYSEVLAARGIRVHYTGCDYSSAFVTYARSRYPTLPFDVADAVALAYADASYDIVVSGCCLLHIPDYEAAVAETARVAKHWAIFHRTPVLHLSPTRYFTKDAYGVKTIEIHFNESALIQLFASHGLHVIGVRTIIVDWRRGDVFAIKSYLCEKSVFANAHATPR